MEPTCDVKEYTFFVNDVFRLPMPERLRRSDVEVFLFREVQTLQYWEEQDPRDLGFSPWGWVRQELRIAEWNLEQWYDLFRDLRLFFYAHPSASTGLPSIHLLAVQEDGENFRRHHMDVLIERRGAVLALIEESDKPPP